MPKLEGTAKDCMLHTELMLSNCFKQCLLDSAAAGSNSDFGAFMAVKNNESKSRIQLSAVGKTYPGDPDCDKITAQFKYRTPVCEDTEDECHEMNCDPVDATMKEYQYAKIEFNECVSEKFSVDEKLFRCSINDLQTDYEEILRDHARSLLRKKNKKIITLLAAEAGTPYVGGDPTTVTPIPLKIFKPTADGCVVPQPMGFDAVTNEFAKQAPFCNDEPVLISGSGKWQSFANARNLFRGNVDGLDASKAPSVDMYYDRAVTTCLADGPAKEPVIGFLPDSIKLIEWRQFTPDSPAYRGQGGRLTWLPNKATPNLTRQVVDLGPILNLRNRNGGVISYPVDMQCYLHDCSEKITITLRDVFTICCLPQDAFCADATYNYKAIFDILCEPYTCSDMTC